MYGQHLVVARGTPLKTCVDPCKTLIASEVARVCRCGIYLCIMPENLPLRHEGGQKQADHLSFILQMQTSSTLPVAGWLLAPQARSASSRGCNHIAHVVGPLLNPDSARFELPPWIALISIV